MLASPRSPACSFPRQSPHPAQIRAISPARILSTRVVAPTGPLPHDAPAIERGNGRVAGDFEVMVTAPVNPRAIEALEARFPVHKLYEAADPEALVTSVAPRVRAIASAAPILANGYAFATTGAFMSRFPALEIVANLGVGYDNIDAAFAAAHGIVVTNTPDVLTDETADLAMALLLATVRELPQADRYLRAGHWLQKPYRLTASLRGRRMGIVGLGRIGKAIATRAEGFGLEIAYHGRKPQPGVPYLYYPTAEALAAACDILMIVAPGGPETRNMIDARVLDALGPDGILVNVARGTLVDEPALIRALQDGRILAAGLDVFAEEPRVPDAMLALDNVVLLPHVGSGSRPTRAEMDKLMVDNLVAFAEGRGPLTPVADTPWRGR